MAFKGSISISTESELDREIKRIATLFQKKETEETWEQFDLALKNLSKWTKEGATAMDSFIPAIKTMKEPIVKSLLTERSRLSGTTTDLLEQLAIHLQRGYEPLSDAFLPHIMRLFTRSNKLFVSRGIKCLGVIIQHAKIPRAIPQFCRAITKPDPNKQMRTGAAHCLTSSIQFNAPSDLEHYLQMIENTIRVGAMDPAPEVREIIRKCFEMYKKQLPEQSVNFISGLSADVRKYLKISGKPEPMRVGKTPGQRSTLVRAQTASSGDVRRLGVAKGTLATKAIYRSHSHPPGETRSALEAPVPKRQASYHIPNGSTKPTAAKRLRTDQDRLGRSAIPTSNAEAALAGPSSAAEHSPPTNPSSEANTRITSSTPSPAAGAAEADDPQVTKDNTSQVASNHQEIPKSTSKTPPTSFRNTSAYRLPRSSLLSSARRSLGDPVRPVKCYHVGEEGTSTPIPRHSASSPTALSSTEVMPTQTESNTTPASSAVEKCSTNEI